MVLLPKVPSASSRHLSWHWARWNSQVHRTAVHHDCLLGDRVRIHQQPSPDF
ncbi:hypothetical protein GQ607_005936 [Colletotrichum asianum]|uniref:Uncharacterized protein n=1 Tax=Colletotrichum asianum TaxID=702518 RepID=A0A8H3WF71_9PEZI|nr:hypothetical protein GQ607_005936 [Colletotrichum asianum]